MEMKTVITSISETIEINTVDTTEPEAAFLDAMRAAGIEYSGPIIADKKLHRIKVNGDRNQNSWYVLHGDGLPAGSFGCWKRGIRETWCAKSNDALTDEERAERDRRWKQQQEIRDAERRQIQDKASVKAQAILDAAQPATDDQHPYLQRKHVKAYPGVQLGAWPQRKADNCLLIPLRTASGKVTSVEAILPNKIQIRGEERDKDFLQGGAKAGAFFVIGDLEASPFILICEGYATGATLHEATGYAVAVAFDAGNLANVTAALKALYPHPKNDHGVRR
jgi:putative DNA primase/helicase